MAIPQLHNEGTDQGGTAASVTPSFAGFTWSANDILEIIFVTDGTIPTLTTANGFAVAQDPVGNSASISTSGGTAGAAECAVTVFWKRAVGSTTGTDPPPVINTNGATSWCLQPNSFSGVRTAGTPYHAITKSTVTTATTAVTSVAATSTLANCLFMPRVASSTDDQAFNNWTFTGSAGPSGSGAPNTGWHNGSGNQCAFTGAEGGFAAAGGPRTATTTFSATTKQALVTLVLASVAEATALTATASIAGATGATAASPTVAGTASAAALGDAGRTAVTATALDTATVALIGDRGAVTATASDTTPPLTATAAIAGGAGATAAGAAVQATATISALGGDGAIASSSIPSANVVAALQGDAGQASAAVTSTHGASAAAQGNPGAIASSVTAPPLATLALGATAFREKANITTPNTGTLTTLPVYPAWAPSTQYAIRTDDRVANAGNTYEVANSANTGTSASSGPGPNTTPAPVTNGAIADGSAHWNFLAAGNGAVDTQATGSLFLVSVGTGKDSTSPGAPTDNKGNTYSLIGSKSSFAGFPDSTAGTYAAALPSAGGTGHTISAAWGAGGDGGGDEKTIAMVEVKAGALVKDHSAIEANPVANVCTSAPVTTTGPAVLVCFCWLNGTTHADGFLHVAVPGSGFAMLPLASGLLEIGSGGGQVHMCTIAKAVASAGTYTATLTTAAGEGAVMQLIAVQASDPPPTRTATAAALGERGATSALAAGTDRAAGAPLGAAGLAAAAAAVDHQLAGALAGAAGSVAAQASVPPTAPPATATASLVGEPGAVAVAVAEVVGLAGAQQGAPGSTAGAAAVSQLLTAALSWEAGSTSSTAIVAVSAAAALAGAAGSASGSASLIAGPRLDGATAGGSGSVVAAGAVRATATTAIGGAAGDLDATAGVSAAPPVAAPTAFDEMVQRMDDTIMELLS